MSYNRQRERPVPMVDPKPLYRVPDPRSNSRLESWKAIAQYLGREVRTVQRWEKTDGLPIHRLYHTKRGSVYADPRELDEWWNSRRSTLAEPPVEDSAEEVSPADAESAAQPVVSPPARSRSRWTLPAIAAMMAAAAAGGWLLRNTEDRPVVTVVTNFPGDEENPSLSPDGQQAAFSWNGPDAGNYDIYVLRLGEGGAKRVTTSPEWDYSPAWSPAGDQIAFLRSNSATLSGTYADVVVVNPNGGPERRIARVKTTGVNLAIKKNELAWTPDGKYLIVCGTDSADAEGLLLVSVNGGEMRRLTLPSKGAFDLEPAIAPSGRLVVFRRVLGYTVSDLYAVPLGSDYGPIAPERPVESHGLIRAGSPQWEAPGRLLYLSDGRLTRLSTDDRGTATDRPREVKAAIPNCTLLSISYRPARPGALLAACDREDSNIWRLELPVSAAGVRLKRVSAGQGVDISPDGKRIVYEVSGPDGMNLWSSSIQGGSPRNLTESRHASTGSPAWSPDGRAIAFDSNYEGRPGIYVMPAGGGAPRALTHELADLILPSWSRDGRWIYFGERIAGKFEVARIPAGGGQVTQVTHGGGTASAESVDGRFVYYIRRVQEAWSLRRCDRDGGQDEEIVPAMLDRAFAVTQDGVYFIPMPGADGRSSIRFWNSATRAVTTITPIQKPQRRPIALAPDGKFLLFSQFDHWGRDLVLLSSRP